LQGCIVNITHTIITSHIASARDADYYSRSIRSEWVEIVVHIVTNRNISLESIPGLYSVVLAGGLLCPSIFVIKIPEKSPVQPVTEICTFDHHEWQQVLFS
jgi:hypothetical protein